ncbi:MAG: hypothetical protein WC700_17140 [Gemmatimonadaceae bacterium]|jgi:hypothetical protein
MSIASIAWDALGVVIYVLLGMSLAYNWFPRERVVVVNICAMDQPPQPPAATYPLTFPDSALTTRRSGR